MRPTWMRARSLRSASFSLRSTAALFLRLFHVDEVDDDEPGQVAQAQLAGDLFGCLHIGLERRLLDVALSVARPELTSMATSASVWLMTI